MLRSGAGDPPAPLGRGGEEDTGDPRPAAGTPLYVHLPFCASKCHYCDFFSVPAAGHDRPAMVAAILAEAERRAPRDPRTVYFGGGTPSLLARAELTTLFDGLQRITGFRDSAEEVTAECNPESLDRAKARALLDLGVGRLSIGIQSLREETLSLFGRAHTAAQGLRAFEAARAAGASNVSVDLIYAAPEQTAAEWEHDLERVLELEPDHLSAYNLTFERETLFHRWLEEGRLAALPEEVELEMFWTTRRVLDAHGFEAYEISNFARGGRRCEHNVNYWRNGAYLGIGPSAVSKVGQTRSGNVAGIEPYVKRSEQGGTTTTWSETPGPENRLAETWWLGLRLCDGIDPVAARATSGFQDGADPALSLAGDLAGQGLLGEDAGRFRLTDRGLPLADWVAKRFLEPTEARR